NRAVHIFFFQAEDGIRDFHVTGVQTCALPISLPDRQCGVLISARRKGLIDEKMPRDVANLVEHRGIRNALIAQALHESLASARRGHPDPGAIAVLHVSRPCNHSHTSSSTVCRLRSICSGVTDT